jgi:hypothetical protein
MKSVLEQNEIKRIGVKSEGAFTIKATSKAFRILSDGLYSDKITAIIRELSCNAYDAHVEAGTLDTPFTMHLPTQFEPQFSIRDFGVGLKHDDIIHVYTTYFESTKTHSNEFIGCLGLGSKSPFSYVDNFTIVSFYKNEKRTYNAFMNEDGLPDIALMSEMETDEHDGIEVSFAVSNTDFRSFYSRVPNVFRYFKLHPEISGHKDIKIDPIEYGLKGNGWGIRTGGSYYSGARAIMGNVSYPLGDMDYDKVTTDEWAIITSDIDIQFDIGDLEVAASRENISFNKLTIKNVKARLADLVSEVSTQVSAELNSCPTLWDARIRAIELSNGTYSALKTIFNVGALTYNGEEVEGGLATSIVPIPKDIRDELDIDCFAPRSRKRRNSRYSCEEGKKIVGLIKDLQGVNVKATGFKFFLKDIDRGSHCRAKQVIEESKHTDSPIDSVYLLNKIDFDGALGNAIGRLMAVLGYEGTIEPISSIVRPKRASNGSNGVNSMNSKKLLVYQTDRCEHDEKVKSSYWTTEKVDVRNGGLYVGIDRYKVNGYSIASEYIEPLLTALRIIGVDMTDLKIIGVKTAMSQKVREDDNWVHLQEYTRDLVKKYLEDGNFYEDLVKAQAYYTNGSNTRLGNFIVEHIDNWDLDTDSPIFKYWEILEDWKESTVAVRDINSLISKAGIGWTTVDTGDDINKLQLELSTCFTAIDEAYPMLNMVIDSYQYKEEIVSEYMTQMEELNKKDKD